MLVENVRFLAGYRRSRLVDEAPLNHAFARVVIGGHLIPVICRPTCSMRSISGLPTGPRVRCIATLLVSIHDGMFRKGSGS